MHHNNADDGMVSRLKKAVRLIWLGPQHICLVLGDFDMSASFFYFLHFFSAKNLALCMLLLLSVSLFAPSSGPCPLCARDPIPIEGPVLSNT